MARLEATTGVSTGVLTQLPALAQAGSPPPVTLAVFDTVVLLMAPCGVTGITKLTALPGATFDRPEAMVHSTVWLPDGLVAQFAGKVPIVNPAGTTSVTVAVADVAAAPVLVTVIV